ncbi:hypothetical protein TorRG33x02_255590 [Trema orientale]|uniref:Uncharacterized protein n=1 Tax=Trema orientale TaxID=63057 RepID=A0A2P5DCN4_TREOI|nr:hypothetical protein TorRG33x02_255590 [Trema orientale]
MTIEQMMEHRRESERGSERNFELEIRKNLEAFVNLVAYYFLGILVDNVLGFWLDLREKGI